MTDETQQAPTVTAKSAPLFSRRALLVLLLASAALALLALWRLGLTVEGGQAAALVLAVLLVVGGLAQFVRTRFRLSVRTMLIGMTVLGVLLGILGGRLIERRRQLAAAAKFERLGVQFQYDDVGASGDWIPTSWGIALPAWLAPLIGDHPSKRVTMVSFYNSTATDADLTDFAQTFPRLKRAKLLDSRLTGSCLRHLRELTELEEVWLDGNQATDAGVEALRGNSNLKSIMLGGPTVTDEHVAALPRLPQLQKLALGNSPKISSAGFAELPRLQRLESLRIHGPGLDDAGLKHIANIDALHFLSIRSSAITDTGLMQLAEHQGLRNLHLTVNANISDAGVELLRARLPNCQIIVD